MADNLRNTLIRLAYGNPEARSEILALVAGKRTKQKSKRLKKRQKKKKDRKEQNLQLQKMSPHERKEQIHDVKGPVEHPNTPEALYNLSMPSDAHEKFKKYVERKKLKGEVPKKMREWAAYVFPHVRGIGKHNPLSKEDKSVMHHHIDSTLETHPERPNPALRSPGDEPLSGPEHNHPPD